MRIDHPEKRLQQFWGEVDKKHIASFSGFLIGKNVLDMGCGLGTTTAQITKLGFNCFGIDYEPAAIEYCKKTFPHCRFQTANAEQLPFTDGYFDTVVLRDALHHFYGEADFHKIRKEISRVSKPNARIIFFDPNVNFMLRTMRKIAFHKDAECDYSIARKVMLEMNFRIIHSTFNTVYSLPLSGGYVGINFIPNIKFIQNFVLRTELFFERILNGLGLGRQLCWRYLLVGQK